MYRIERIFTKQIPSSQIFIPPPKVWPAWGLLQALRVVLARVSASSASFACTTSSPPRTSTLRILWQRSTWSRWWCWVSRSWLGSSGWSIACCRQLALNKCQCLLAILGAVLLVGVGIVAVAAVGIGGVTVWLNICSGRLALETGWTRCELYHMLVGWSFRRRRHNYALSSARSNIVGKSVHVSWVSLEDNRRNLAYCCRWDGDILIWDARVGISASAICVVKDLTSLEVYFVRWSSKDFLDTFEGGYKS